jgi:hypothetical protein
MPEGVTNGTIFANTTAVKSEADCQLATTVFLFHLFKLKLACNI